ncbi:alkaline shock response membrane anchor protein AmaP [Enterococcus lactis]
MNKGLKITGVIMSLLLLSVFLAIALINAPYIMPEQLERFRFFTLTNYYMQQYIFWAAEHLPFCYYHLASRSFLSKIKRNFRYETGRRQIDDRQKAIEGLVRSHLHEEEFIHSPKVRIRSTKNRIHIHVNGDLKRTSSLVGKTGVLMQDIEEEVTRVLGTKETVKVAVTYSGYEEQEDTRDYKHSRVE